MNLLDKNYILRKHMLVHQAIPGYWYTNILGQLQQVRVVLHEGSEQRRVVLENINGKRQTVDIEGWYQLDLTLHSPGIERRRTRSRRDSGKSS
ncbi:hypothetical protein MNBD_GAMMA15-581 [hydrothermal vent metagenome]|uniref:Uncharacterized protein n=1 Tax=hydrothermal vent metagenome TaxID=652676 RepID=A0A3B0YCC2_9ZZZZ